MSARQEKVREALFRYGKEIDPDDVGVWDAALAEVEEWEARDADYAGYGEIMESLTVRAEAAEAEADRLKAALDDIEACPEDTLRVQAVARAALAPADRNTA